MDTPIKICRAFLRLFLMLSLSFLVACNEVESESVGGKPYNPGSSSSSGGSSDDGGSTGDTGGTGGTGGTGSDVAGDDGAEVEVPAFNNDDGARLEVKASISWEGEEATEVDLTTFTFEDSDPEKSTRYFNLPIAESRLFQSDLHFTVSANTNTNCKWVSFQPYYFRYSYSAAFLNPEDNKSIDCSKTDGTENTGCYGGVAKDFVSGFPKNRSVYFPLSAAFTSKYTMKSGNSLNVQIGNRWAANELARFDENGAPIAENAAIIAAGAYEDSDEAFSNPLFIPNYYYDYTFTCRDYHGDPYYTIVVYVKDVNSDPLYGSIINHIDGWFDLFDYFDSHLDGP